MSWLRKSGLVFLLALWALATIHCQLEAVPGLEFLSCCHHHPEQPTPGHHAEDCDNDGCSVIESGLYKQEEPLYSPVLSSLAFGVLFAELTGDDAEDCLLSVAVVPLPSPELARQWQFHQRTALPPRAPSFPV